MESLKSPINMGHNHHKDLNNIKFAFFINLLFTIIEIIGDVFTNSVAILSDAVDDFGDSISLGLA
jgi:cobalt-zinc-cadmium efflux system protein